MALTVTGKLIRDVRLDPEGRIAAGGRLFLRGETVPVHPDYAAQLLAPAKVRKVVKRQADKQAQPPADKQL